MTALTLEELDELKRMEFCEACAEDGNTPRLRALRKAIALATTNSNGERDAVLRRTELVGKADVVDTGVERAQPETVAAPAITDPWFGSAKLEAPLPEPIAAGEECICPEDVVRHGFHQDCPIHGYAQPPIAAGLSNIMSGLWRSAEDQVLELAKVLQTIAEEPVNWNTTDHHYYAGIVGRFQLLANGILKSSPPIAGVEELTWSKAGEFTKENWEASARKLMDQGVIPSSSDLVERLRNRSIPDQDTEDAADTIQRLEAENKRLAQCKSGKLIGAAWKLNAEAQATIAALQSERDRLREALEKIADWDSIASTAELGEVARAALAGKD
jgi:hypothetical protein